ncbi:hypothetical protein [Kocuria sp.]|uniref:hypothetical protein n=1 Tax=Kocuria sp. TaxID=1871328 RepID=UPI0026E0B340|nr:hypothetical protein [Kocuria sp.]MDO5618949.1 hypothetical protein [Kocuria sp.]
MTAWFAAIGLLNAAWELNDTAATLHWRPLTCDSDAPPVVPVLRSHVPIEVLVEHILTHDEWSEAEKLTTTHGFPKGIGVKNQKWNPSSAARGLVQAADEHGNRLLISLASDLGPAEKGKDNAPGALPMPITQIANNSSYTAVALRRTAFGSKDIRQNITEVLNALTALNAGYGLEQCDGGMDRVTTDPGINGLGVDAGRLTRTAIAPLAVFGESRVGVGLSGGAGVTNRSVALPLPVQPLTAPELRTLTHIGLAKPSWDWSNHGLGWVYRAHRQKKGDYEYVWTGSPVKRAEVKRNSMNR